MLPSFTILLPLAAFLPLTLTAPSPRGGGLALAGLVGAVAAEAETAYSLDGADPPDAAGYGATSTCTYNGGSATNAAASDPAWISSMTGCLNALDGDNWNGTACTPPVGGETFGFWKGENDYPDAVDCYQRCAGCLSSAINAGQAVTTKCQYEYDTHREIVGYKTHTCTMGYDAPK